MDGQPILNRLPVGRSVTGAIGGRCFARVPTSFGCFQTGRIINSIKPRPRSRRIGLDVYTYGASSLSRLIVPGPRRDSTRLASRGKKMIDHAIHALLLCVHAPVPGSVPLNHYEKKLTAPYSFSLPFPI